MRFPFRRFAFRRPAAASGRSAKHVARSLAVLLLVAACFAAGAASAQVALDLETAKLAFTERGVASLTFADGTTCPNAGRPAFLLTTAQGSLRPTACSLAGDELKVAFEDGSTAQFAITRGRGFATFRLTKLATKADVARFGVFAIGLPADATVRGILNAAHCGKNSVAVLAGEPNVHTFHESQGAPRGDRPGCSHQLTQTSGKVGLYAAKFDATCDEKGGGWSVQGTHFPGPIDLTGCKALRAWVHGDGNGQALKIQLLDGAGGYRDDYIPIDFKGWKQVTLDKPALNTIQYGRIAGLNLYYNSLPAAKSVSCLVDRIEAVVDRNGQEQTIVLEDFEATDAPIFAGAARVALYAETVKQHGIEPAVFGVAACPKAELLDAIEKFQQSAGVPSPKLGGKFNKISPWIKRSYLFITNFHESQCDEVIAMARRGGFDMILIGQESWTTGTGHYNINRGHFPNGLESLKSTIRRLKDAGFHVGLHVLAASIYPPDPYITPVPDPRLFKRGRTALTADIDEKAATITVESMPEHFPDKDGGYLGDGLVFQIGDELISYGGMTKQAPYTFTQCQRGHLGTKPAPHKKGAAVDHLVRAYGYHMYDMDTTLLNEVAGNFAKVADACDIDMVYFDGSELLQGDHWYYNAKMHKAFYDKIARKDILMQASSTSHYSWNLMARNASADGHGDLKGYLDERSGVFDWFADGFMPLDVGWYYGYDANCVIDMYEYVLGTTIGYDSSMSFQVSCDAARAHPFTGEILDMIRRYEQLRLSGRVPAEMKERLRIDPALRQVLKPEAPKDLVDKRRDYRLLGEPGREVFQRIVYTPWQEFPSAAEAEKPWTIEVKQGPAAVGFEVQARGGALASPGPAYTSSKTPTLESFENLRRYAAAPGNRRSIQSLKSGEGGSTSPGVTMKLTLSDADPRVGKHCLLYSATNPAQSNDGWSYVGRSFDPPIDMAWHKAIGFWMRGDGQGGQFKLQLTDGKNAEDYYVANDYVGWRYHQLVRPDQSKVDYKKVRSLGFYYNGLPGGKTVTCAIDDVKVLREVETPMLRNPYVEIDGKKIAWNGKIRSGQFMLYRPGEEASLHGRPLPEAQRQPVDEKPILLPVGKHEVRFGCEGGVTAACRARITLQPPERHTLPAAAAK